MARTMTTARTTMAQRQQIHNNQLKEAAEGMAATTATAMATAKTKTGEDDDDDS